MAIQKNNTKNTDGKSWCYPPPTKAIVTRAKWVNDSISFDMIVNDIAINNCWYRSGTKDGNEWEAVSLPQYKGKDNKYYSYVFFPITKELKEAIIRQIQSLLG